MKNDQIVRDCRKLLKAYKDGRLGQTVMPEDSHPDFGSDDEARITYFTLPMSLNYQRDSYSLWKAALATYEDSDTRFVFDIAKTSTVSEAILREALLKHKLALQPNKHVHTWSTIAHTVHRRWGSFSELIRATNNDFISLKEAVQIEEKKGFPYLSGPKIFNYWAFILGAYGGVTLSNRDRIGIAPDTHILKCSVKLGAITSSEAETLSREAVSERWRAILSGSGIDPIDMHPPLWFWSRNGFLYSLE